MVLTKTSISSNFLDKFNLDQIIKGRVQISHLSPAVFPDPQEQPQEKSTDKVCPLFNFHFSFFLGIGGFINNVQFSLNFWCVFLGGGTGGGGARVSGNKQIFLFIIYINIIIN
jgi:hypothetical protein